MRLLVYGFGPYGQFNDNISEKLLKNIPPRREVKKIVFPIRFNKSQFLKVLRKYKPDAVLGLGQCSRWGRLRIERRAVNRRREPAGKTLKPIVPGGSKWLASNLKLDRDRQARFSTDAGDYVCNYSMYVILDYVKRHHLPTRFGFVHIPHDYNLAKAKRFLLSATKAIYR